MTPIRAVQTQVGLQVLRDSVRTQTVEASDGHDQEERRQDAAAGSLAARTWA